MVFGNPNIVKGGEDEAYFISLYNRYKDMMFSIANNVLAIQKREEIFSC